jgi:hypothetical protein
MTDFKHKLCDSIFISKNLHDQAFGTHSDLLVVLSTTFQLRPEVALLQYASVAIVCNPL